MYSVGIDLGTTNSALAEVESLESSPPAPASRCPRPSRSRSRSLIAPGETAALELLPSFVYLPRAVREARAMPSSGRYARERGAQVPGQARQLVEAWLSRGSTQLLPSGAEAEVPRISPLGGRGAHSRPLRDAWDPAHYLRAPKAAPSRT